MNYQEAMTFLEETKHYGIVPGLSNIRHLCEELDNPQESLRIVHIAGTNGKGAVGRMIATCMKEAGYRTGHFATPDVFEYEEIIQINGRDISKEELADIFGKVRNACANMTIKGFPHPTKFEVETAAAFLYFQEKGCDCVVAEVGMGGVEDATNLIRSPLVSVLTAIGMDHMQYLGGSLAKIAAKKAGIIKQNCPVVTQRQEEEAISVIRKCCSERSARLVIADSGQAEVLQADACGSRFAYKGEEYEICLGGRFQIDNAVNAIETLGLLQSEYPMLDQKSIRDGLRKTVWPGRFERIGTEPDFFLDGAHNPPAARRLKESRDLYFTDRKIVYIMGVLADKSYEEVAKIMFCRGDIVYTVTSSSPRALPGEELAACLNALGQKTCFCASLEEAVRLAVSEAGRDGIVLAFGSLSYLGDLREAYLRVK